jgi:hypothetical protein
LEVSSVAAEAGNLARVVDAVGISQTTTPQAAGSV